MDTLHEGRMESYVGLLGQLREIDHHHTALVEWRKAEDFYQEPPETVPRRAGAVPVRPVLDGSITDRVNAFASKEIRAALGRALPADKLLRDLVTSGRTVEGSPAGAAFERGTPANDAYLQFRAVHRDIVDLVRTETSFPRLVDGERELFVLLARRMDNASIATELNISRSDLRHRIAEMLSCLSLSSREEAVNRAHDAGIGA